VLQNWEDHFSAHLNITFPRDENAASTLEEREPPDNPQIISMSHSYPRRRLKKLLSRWKIERHLKRDGITAEVLKHAGKWCLFWKN